MKDKGKAIVIECEAAEIADEIAANPNSKKLCQRFGKKSLVIFDADETKFREIVRKIGYGVKY